MIPPDEYSASGYGRYRLFFNTPEVPIWSDEKVVEFVKPRIQIFIDAFEKGTMPPMCDDDMRAWKCDRYCPVKDLCDRVEHGEPLT
jgi:hypothetical protein